MQRPIQLLSGTGKVISGILCLMRNRHLQDYETVWQDVLLATGQPDRDWGWDYKLRRGERNASDEAYAIEVDNLTQGLMLIETQRHRSQLPQRYPLVYVEALVTAPWNRRRLEKPPYLRGVGRTLLLFARQRSLELGFGGRVGLHALPGSEAFYHRNQMLEYDADPEKEDWVSFEYGIIQR